MIRVIKILLFLPMVVFELLLLCFCWVLALCTPKLASPIVEWAQRLPDPKWYFKKELDLPTE